MLGTKMGGNRIHLAVVKALNCLLCVELYATRGIKWDKNDIHKSMFLDIETILRQKISLPSSARSMTPLLSHDRLAYRLHAISDSDRTITPAFFCGFHNFSVTCENQQDRQCMYNATPWRVLATIFALEEQ